MNLMNGQIILASNFSMPAVDYAGQGNAILGIRDAGKTYTAMKAAEELLDNNVPIIVYDPVGVWKNLKIGTGNNKGFPVVVAGGQGSDITLNVNNAVQIVRAAMKENVSLVIDLYSPELINKSTWIRIVQETVDILMYENKECGLRHIFIEEAAEFIPQRLQPQHSKVYASLERLARMGRNARLGYTLINQRAEEVNKAILEISAFSLLHKQVGKNSLKSIQQWMDLLQVENAKEIIHSLPGLKQGECWVIGMHTKPHRIKVAARKTFHPDPKQPGNDNSVSKLKIDVSSFVEKLNKQLPNPEEKKINTASLLKQEDSTHRQKVVELQNLIKAKEIEISDLRRYTKKLENKLESIREILSDKPSQLNPSVPNEITANVIPSEKLSKCALAILQFLATYMDRSFTKTQVGIATGYSPNSGGFNNALSELGTKGLISRGGARLMVNRVSNLLEWTGDFEKKTYSIDTYLNKLNKCEREIYQVLLDHPRKGFSKQELADATESKYSYTSGGFNNAISTLNTLELIRRSSGIIILNPELLEI